MKTHSHATHSASQSTPASESTTELAPATSVPSATPAARPLAPPLPQATATPLAPTAATSIASPPGDAHIPTPPSTATATNPTDYKGVQPKVSEQAALKPAIADLQKFVSYTQLLGGAAPPIAHVIVLLTLGVEWTGMRNATSAWDTYCRTQEGLVWAQIRAVMDRLKPAWALAVMADASLASQ